MHKGRERESGVWDIKASRPHQRAAKLSQQTTSIGLFQVGACIICILWYTCTIANFCAILYRVKCTLLPVWEKSVVSIPSGGGGGLKMLTNGYCFLWRRLPRLHTPPKKGDMWDWPTLCEERKESLGPRRMRDIFFVVRGIHRGSPHSLRGEAPLLRRPLKFQCLLLSLSSRRPSCNVSVRVIPSDVAQSRTSSLSLSCVGRKTGHMSAYHTYTHSALSLSLSLSGLEFSLSLHSIILRIRVYSLSLASLAPSLAEREREKRAP